MKLEVSQQPAGANGTYTYGHVTEDKANLIMHELDLPGCVKEEENTSVGKYSLVVLIHQWFLYTTFYGS